MAGSATPAKRDLKAGRAAYAAFVSYSHSDSEVCDRLHRRLESYAVPHSLVGRRGPDGVIGKRLGKFFRDRADLGAHHDLGAEIREALDASSALIVLCSPRSAGSPYVEEEIRYFKSLGRGERIFAAIISGEPHAAGKPGLTAADECFPRALIYRIGPDGAVSSEPEAVEPIAADLRDKKDGIENGALKLIAGMLDVGLDDLVQRERQAEARRRRQANLIAGAMAVLALGAGVGGVLAWMNGETAANRAKELKLTNDTLDETNTQLKTTVANLDVAKKDVETKLRENQVLTTRITSVVSEISGIAANNPNVPEEMIFLASGARIGMSAAALQMLFRFEFAGQDVERSFYLDFDDNLCVGPSYCFDDYSKEDFETAWGKVLTPQQLNFVRSLDVQDKAAVAAAMPELRKIQMGRRDVIRVFGDAILPKTVATVLRIWPDAEMLSPDCVGALASLVFNMGAGSRQTAAVGDLIRARRFSDVPAEIRRIGEVQGQRFRGLQIRREAEAALFERGLQAATPSAPPAR